MRHDELFDEARLRRALRLEAGELPPQLEVAAIAARAAAAPGAAAVLASLSSAVLAGMAAAALVALGAATVAAIAPAVTSDLFGRLMGAIAVVAIPLGAIVAAAQQPTIPIAVLAATVLAIRYEYGQRRERVDAVRAT